MFWYIFLGIPIVVTFIQYLWYTFKPRTKVQGKHVLISGGSKGIGKAIAIELVKRGAKVTIGARSLKDLEITCKEIETFCIDSEASINYVQMDVTNFSDVCKAVEKCMAKQGPIDYLFACAGVSHPDYFNSQPVNLFSSTMDLNYLGTVHTLKAVSPGMISRCQGHVVLIGSAMSLLGFAGYASYAPSKWAVRGLADCLRNEYLKHGVKVSVSYPPDTKTPGFEQELTTRTPEIQALSSESDVYPVETVAFMIVDDVLSGHFHISSPDFVQNLLISAKSGLSPRRYICMEILLAPLLVIVLEGFRLFVDYISRTNPIKSKLQ